MRYETPTNIHEAAVLAIDIFNRVEVGDEPNRTKAFCMADYFFNQMTNEEIHKAELVGDYQKS